MSAEVIHRVNMHLLKVTVRGETAEPVTKTFRLKGNRLAVNLNKLPLGSGLMTLPGGEKVSCRVYQIKRGQRTSYQSISGPMRNGEAVVYVGPEIYARELPTNTEGNPLRINYQAYGRAQDALRNFWAQRADS